MKYVRDENPPQELWSSGGHHYRYAASVYPVGA